MNAALLRLLWLSLRGRALRLARQLRHPKYLVGFAVGVGWIVFWVGSWGRSDAWKQLVFTGFHAKLTADLGSMMQLAFSAFFAVLICAEWLLPWSRFGLPLRESDLHLLLPAPITRRQLIRFALLKAQVPILFSTTIVSAMLGSGRPGGQLRLFLALWLFFTIWDLHGRWRGLTLLRLRELSRGRARAMRVGIAAVVLTYLIAVLARVQVVGRAVYAELAGADLRGDDGVLAALERIAHGAHDQLLETLLTPFLWVTGPVFAQAGREFALALLAPVVLLLVLQALIVHSSVRFEEAAIEHARREADRRSPQRRYAKMSAGIRRRGPFSLPPRGRPGRAILWKNIAQVWRAPLGASTGLAVGAITLIASVLVLIDAPDFVFGIFVGFGGWLLAFAPLICGISFRNDFRTELRYIETVRSWPVRPWQFVLHEALSPALLGTLLSFLGAISLLAGFYGARLTSWMHGREATFRVVGQEAADIPVAGIASEWALPVMLTGAIPLAAGVAVLVSSLHNLGTLMFPAWVSLGPRAGRGMAASGQNLLFATALGLALLLGMIPGVVLVGLAAWAQWTLRIGWSVLNLPLWGLLAALPLFGEAALIVRAGARRWERLDASQEILESGR